MSITRLPSPTQFSIIKRNGRFEPYTPAKAVATLQKLSYGLDVDFLHFDKIIDTVSRGIVNGLTTRVIQHELSRVAADLIAEHPDYAILAGRLEVSELHHSTQKSFLDFVTWLSQVDTAVFSDAFVHAVVTHGEQLDHALRHARDYDYQYISFKSLEQSYLLRHNGVVIERPQWLFMRVAVALHGTDLPRVLETYDLLSRGLYTHATPTLINAGRRRQALSSCFILPADCSTANTTYDGLRDLANIFMANGGVGIDLHTVPAKRTDPPQAGVIPYLRVVDATVRLTSQNKEGRPSALTATLPVWHNDIMEFIEARSNRGQEEFRTRNIFTAVSIPDLFMTRVKENAMWSLFDPRDVPDLLECYGSEFETCYTQLERTTAALTVLPARAIWDHIIDHQIETGTPFILYHDAINRKSNHQHQGVIHASNLCTEIMQHISSDSTAVCTLSSLILPAFVTPDGEFDFDELHRVTKVVVRNTDRVLDINDYPTPQAQKSALDTRAIGIGVQGLADTFMMMHIPYDSDDAARLNRDIFETIYHAALDASCDLARSNGPYPTWAGSPASKLALQFDLWTIIPSRRYNWDMLKTRIHLYGLRNSLLTAQMPTASTSQIVGVNDSTEPYISNLYVRRAISGEFQVLNKWLVRDLIAHDLWTEGVRQALLRSNGSIQQICGIPQEIKDIYKTAWEIPQKHVVDMAAGRGPYICQSQSMTIYMAAPTPKKLTSMHFHAWESGLKTGMYYLRSQPAVFPDHFGVMPVYPSPEPAQRTSSDAAASQLNDDTPYATPHADDLPMDLSSELGYPADDMASRAVQTCDPACIACSA